MTVVDPDAGRDRMVNPSINFPQSPEEAAQAIVHSIRRALFNDVALRGVLSKTYTTDAGLGHTRTQAQADWLNEQQSLLRARIEDLLDEIDHCTRSH
jgi:hypothetical protein